ncbi:hypothetical protein EVAR_66005_1 [Eumeta japonica]|uniref:Uncharacterized protein n=1 Tax=Eumeta variegata TaxID=151549 RepID=A0A4C1ZTR8_EUMVA|nr:hypothetical protein EVAR_66005_1 [Eumeta japonica]
MTRFLEGMPYAIEIMNQLEDYVNIRWESSDQHVDVTPARQKRDAKVAVYETMDERSGVSIHIRNIDEKDGENGGCKHALALVMWTHRRSEDPTPTEVACYWKNLDYQALAQL